MRQPTYSTELVEAVLRVRGEYPRWGKDKLVVLLDEQGFNCSASTVGRIMWRLKERGVLKEPIPNHISARKRQRRRPYGVRKPKGYAVSRSGDLVQLDTLDVRPVPGVLFKHFTAHDIISRWNVVGAYTRATATTATDFLDKLEGRMPFRVKAIQVDGGSEFMADFEQACADLNIALYVLPPKKPKYNGGVERSNRIFREEFYARKDLIADSIGEIKFYLKKALQKYNEYRPHKSLEYLTPFEYISNIARLAT